MWGLSSRGARLTNRKRFRRATRIGTATVAVRGHSERASVEIGGELDFTCAEGVRILLESLPHHIAEVDLAELEFIDAEGVRMLRAFRYVRADKQNIDPIPLRRMQSAVRRAWELVCDVSGDDLKLPPVRIPEMPIV